MQDKHHDDLHDVDGTVFLLGNIPKNYHSHNLRNYFSDFIEKHGFICFHYKHRPEHLKNGKLNDELHLQNNQPNQQASQTDGQASGSTKRNTCCCVVVVQNSFENDFIKAYRGKKWKDNKGVDIHQQVVISYICKSKDIRASDHRPAVGSSKTINNEATDDNGGIMGNNGVTMDSGSSSIDFTDLSSLPELNPPDLMPRGNVGTPLSVFMDLIRNCRLPSHVIKKLKLSFQISKTRKQYAAVPMKYDGTTLRTDHAPLLQDHSLSDGSTSRVKRTQDEKDVSSVEESPPKVHLLFRICCYTYTNATFFNATLYI